MSFIYALNWYANDYDQHGGYTLCVFKNKPSFIDLKDAIENQLTNCDLAKPPRSDATYGKLSRGESVNQRFVGHWEIVQLTLIN